VTNDGTCSANVSDGWSATPRPFAPHIKAGQELAFRLEAVPFRWKPVPGARRGKREELLTAVRRMHSEAREDQDREATLVHAEAVRWFAEQGAKHARGFASGRPCTRKDEPYDILSCWHRQWSPLYTQG
jgi:hypothetical protein